MKMKRQLPMGDGDCSCRIVALAGTFCLEEVLCWAAPSTTASSAIFLLNPELLRSISGKPISLCVSVYMGRMGPACGFRSEKLLGRVRTTVELGAEAEGRTCVLQSGWLGISKEGKPSAQLHLVVRSEPDPRFLFRFGGEPACSPVVLQMQRNIWQPVFSCKFSADRNSLSCWSCIKADLCHRIAVTRQGDGCIPLEV
ncbi:hypothetical protein MRB53_004999 [Persea americana]|uniref:Uncharacterized protein n=1 Tax=Persea americana TaxID=3435 RepID=A0ACC2MCZ8_PERAE|nr:hypothetical protein MRB53_004999 [Persea americana]